MIISDEKILRLKSTDVEPSEINELISKLEQGLNYSNLMGRPGIGLSAIQLGIPKRAAIIRINNGISDNLSVNLINAQISKKYNSFLFKDEGCLSFNNKVQDTMRYQEICVINNAVKPHAFIATGLMAVAIQHELDHFDGILFFDHTINSEKNAKQRPNDECLCGSKKKYKKCCKLIKEI